MSAAVQAAKFAAELPVAASTLFSFVCRKAELISTIDLLAGYQLFLTFLKVLICFQREFSKLKKLMRSASSDVFAYLFSCSLIFFNVPPRSSMFFIFVQGGSFSASSDLKPPVKAVFFRIAANHFLASRPGLLPGPGGDQDKTFDSSDSIEAYFGCQYSRHLKGIPRGVDKSAGISWS